MGRLPRDLGSFSYERIADVRHWCRIRSGRSADRVLSLQAWWTMWSWTSLCVQGRSHAGTGFGPSAPSKEFLTLGKTPYVTARFRPSVGGGLGGEDLHVGVMVGCPRTFGHTGAKFTPRYSAVFTSDFVLDTGLILKVRFGKSPGGLWGTATESAVYTAGFSGRNHNPPLHLLL